MASVKITVFGIQCLGDKMEAIFSSKMFVNLVHCVCWTELSDMQLAYDALFFLKFLVIHCTVHAHSTMDN
jgi:hypothetical protein